VTLPLTSLGLEMLSWLPAHLQRSTDAQGIVDIEAREAERIEAGRTDLLDQFFVQTATWGLNSWEQALQLPVEPVNEFSVPLSTADRRQIILSKLRSNIVQSAAEWRGVLDTYVTDYKIRIDHTLGILYVSVSYDPSAYSEAQLETLIRSITPAHYDLNVQYVGFLAGISEAGDTV
jgi:uncharacterized protein YmfQ (DUF2313 family)